MDASSTFFCKTQKESNGKKLQHQQLVFKIKYSEDKVSSLMVLNADAFSGKAIKIVNKESEVAFEALL